MCNDLFDDHYGPDWQEDWMVIGPLSEDIANEELEIEKACRGTLGENGPFTDMDEENIDTDFDFDPEAD